MVLPRHYPRDMAPFSAIADATADAYADLAVDLLQGIEARLLCPTEEPTPAGWETVGSWPIIQMVADHSVQADAAFGERLLGADDAHEMRRLTEIAKPGPFGTQAHMLGNYVGYRDRDKLIALGGQRLRLPGFVELSAILRSPERPRSRAWCSYHLASHTDGLGARGNALLARLS